MLVKTILVLIYLLVVFLAAKVLDITSSWLDLSCVASQLVNPFALSVKKLKTLLDERGVSYAGIVDKRDLAQLVQESGSLNTEENCTSVENELQLGETSAEVTHFKSSSHLFEEVEDTKASGWLVLIIPQRKKPLLREKQWQQLARKVTRFGIRTGVFDCNLEPVLCSRNSWGEQCLILSSPQDDKPKGHVVINVYKSKPSVELAFGWMNTILAKKIERIDSHEQYASFLQKDPRIYGPTKIVLFGRLDDPPALLSSLSIKFTGRVKFGYFKITHDNLHDMQEKIGIHKAPRLLVIMPEMRLYYGSRKGEMLHYKAFELFLTNLHPEVNDLFLITIILINLACFLEPFLTPGGILRKSFKLFLLVGAANTVLIIIWLPLLSLSKLTFFQPVLNVSLKICRYTMTSNLASLVRYHYLTHVNSTVWILIGFCAYCILLNRLKKRLKCIRGSDGEDDETIDWFHQDIAYFRRLFYSFPSNRIVTPNMQVGEDNLNLFIQRLAIPDLWLHPILPTDFVKDLPLWKKCGCALQKRGFQNCDKNSTNCNPGMCEKTNRPEHIILGKECVICLELYSEGCLMVSLPCLHGFHQKCLEKWFNSGNHCRSLNCPVCRWPAYKQKSQIINIPQTFVSETS